MRLDRSQIGYSGVGKALLFFKIMTKLHITNLHRKKLKILTKHYFPEFTSVNFDSLYCKDYIILFKNKLRLKIHWFEWTMTHLSVRLINSKPNYHRLQYRYILENNWNCGEWQIHPIDLLYKEYLNETVN